MNEQNDNGFCRITIVFQGCKPPAQEDTEKEDISSQLFTQATFNMFQHTNPE